MKLHALVIAAALAFAGTAFAQSGDSYGSSGSAPMADGSHKAAATHVHKKKVAKAKKAHARRHASAMHEHHDMHARAHAEHRGTGAMGAGPAAPVTDLGADSRQRRMNSAYEDWLRLQQRR